MSADIAAPLTAAARLIAASEYVVVMTGADVQFRDLTGGSSRASQNAMSVRFGLGQWTGADWVAVLWPDGRQTVVTGVEGDQVLYMP